MAIKFSQFVLKTLPSELDYIVGYKGTENLQITPDNFLAPYLGDYLPLAGGTMTGNVILNDSVEIKFGTSGAESFIYSDGSDTYFQANNGNIWFYQGADDKAIKFSCDDGAGGVTEYFRIDGQYEVNRFIKNARFNDSVKANFGTADDLQIYYDGTDSKIHNDTGHLVIEVDANDKDLQIFADDGSGGLAEYFRIDGSLEAIRMLRQTRWNDNINATFGNADDLRIYHNGTNSNIENFAGDLQIIQNLDDGDIIFRCDDGSGGTATYFFLDGSEVRTTFNKEARFIDSAKLKIGTSGDLEIFHDGTDSYIQNATGNLKIVNYADDKRIEFQNDDGSGGVETYFYCDGAGGGSQPFTVWPDEAVIAMGTNHDTYIQHTGAHFKIDNYTGNVEINQQVNDGDILFKSDDGSGGLATYMYLDGGNTRVQFNKSARFVDSAKVMLGTSDDLQLYHDGTDSLIRNTTTGNLYIENQVDDKDIIFKADDGSGGAATYFYMDGSIVENRFSKATRHSDNVIAKFGDGNDLNIYHNATNSYISNITGDLYIEQLNDNGDIIFKSDNGSGGTATYFYVDGGNEAVRFSKDSWHNDDVKAMFGTGTDLQIYHDGSNSYIDETGTGSLYIRSAGAIRLQSDTGENMIYAVNDSSVYVYHNNSKKLETTSTGTKTTGQMDLAALNTAPASASAAGTTGEIRFTADYIYVCTATNTWKRAALSTW